MLVCGILLEISEESIGECWFVGLWNFIRNFRSVKECVRTFFDLFLFFFIDKLMKKH